MKPMMTPRQTAANPNAKIAKRLRLGGVGIVAIGWLECEFIGVGDPLAPEV
jgi:hypothetical protein